MSRFKRENRYVVFKRKNLSHAQGKVLRNVESELWPDGNVKECLVVEHDWPCYDAAWNMIVELSKGEFSDPYAEIKQLKQRCAELEAENKGLSIRISVQRETIRRYQEEVAQLRKEQA